MIEALEGASSLQLYQLKALIEGMLADPRRGIAARASLHLGQAVQFVHFRDGQMRRGKIIAMKDTQATVLEEGTKRANLEDPLRSDAGLHRCRASSRAGAVRAAA